MILAYHYSYQCRANIPLTHVENDVVVSTWGCAVAESVLLFCFDASVIGFITTIAFSGPQAFRPVSLTRTSASLLGIKTLKPLNPAQHHSVNVSLISQCSSFGFPSPSDLWFEHVNMSTVDTAGQHVDVL